MKRLACMALLAALLTGCRSSTEFGPCIGAFDDKDSTLHYKLSVRNTVLGVVFFETVVVPIVVVANQALCPDRRAAK